MSVKRKLECGCEVGPTDLTVINPCTTHRTSDPRKVAKMWGLKLPTPLESTGKIISVESDGEGTHNILVEANDGKRCLYRRCRLNTVSFDLSLADHSSTIMVGAEPKQETSRLASTREARLDEREAALDEAISACRERLGQRKPDFYADDALHAMITLLTAMRGESPPIFRDERGYPLSLVNASKALDEARRERDAALALDALPLSDWPADAQDRRHHLERLGWAAERDEYRTRAEQGEACAFLMQHGLGATLVRDAVQNAAKHGWKPGGLSTVEKTSGVAASLVSIATGKKFEPMCGAVLEGTSLLCTMPAGHVGGFHAHSCVSEKES